MCISMYHCFLNSVISRGCFGKGEVKHNQCYYPALSLNVWMQLRLLCDSMANSKLAVDLYVTWETSLSTFVLPHTSISKWCLYGWGWVYSLPWVLCPKVFARTRYNCFRPGLQTWVSQHISCWGLQCTVTCLVTYYVLKHIVQQVICPPSFILDKEKCNLVCPMRTHSAVGWLFLLTFIRF